MRDINLRKIFNFLILLSLSTANAFFITKDEHVDEKTLLAHKTSVIQADATANFRLAQSHGSEIFAFLSLTELPYSNKYTHSFKKLRAKPIAKTALWHDNIFDPTDAAWKKILLEWAQKIVDLGFDGFYLNKIENIKLIAEKYPAKAKVFWSGIEAIVRELKTKFPNKKILMEEGFEILDSVHNIADGFVANTLFQKYDFKNKAFELSDEAQISEKLKILNKAKKKGLKVYVKEYCHPSEIALGNKIAAKVKKAGYEPIIVSPKYRTQMVAPIRPIRRHWFCIYGKPKNNGNVKSSKEKRPDKTLCHKLFQLPFECYGHEVNYCNFYEENLPFKLSFENRGIIIDESFVEPKNANRQAHLVNWIIWHKAHGFKVLFLGKIPNFIPKRLFNLKGNNSVVEHIEKLEVLKNSPSFIDKEIKVKFNKEKKFYSLHSNSTEGQILSLQATDKDGQQYQFDPIFTAKWGGAILSPYIYSNNADGTLVLKADLFKFVKKFIKPTSPRPEWIPVPDTTTLQGLRSAFIHVDGDGIFDSAQDENKPLISKLKEQIFIPYGFPTTISVITKDFDKLDEIQYNNFVSAAELPFIDVATHSHTHPYFWQHKKNKHIPDLKQSHNFSNAEKVNLSREIRKSISILNKKLFPIYKKTNIFLWSGDSRPSPQAIRLLDSLGVNNINGGSTSISKQNNFQAFISPKSIHWKNALQCLAPMQNEFFYTNERQDSSYKKVLETFELTESPFRIKPVNVHYDFYVAKDVERINTLETVYNWLKNHELSFISARRYTDIVKDSYGTKIFYANDNNWIIVSDGKIRTLRIPVSSKLYPDLKNSKGILGFRDVNNARYIHTDGSRRVELKLIINEPHVPYLVYADAHIQFFCREDKSLKFFINKTSHHKEKCSVCIAGFAKNAKLKFKVNQHAWEEKLTDQKGQIVLNLPKLAMVEVSNFD